VPGNTDFDCGTGGRSCDFCGASESCVNGACR
jgi:hypothetical protein